MSVVLQHPLFSYTTTTICTTGESLAFDAGESAHTTPRLELLSQSRIILVRDPPRERLPGTRSSEENLEHEQVLQPLPSFLVRSAGKSEAEPKIIHTHHHAHTPICSIDCKGIPNENAITEFYADLYQYYMSDATAAHLGFHVATSEPPSGKPENGGKVRMAKKRGSLQAIFVSSFLQNGPMSPPSISPPTSPTKSKSRLRALSAATPSSPTESVVSVASNSTISSDASGSQHQRKRSFTVGFNSVNSATPSRCSPPPAYLLDDDPFANLIAAPSITLKRKFSSGSSSNSATRPSTGSSSNDVPAVPFIPPVPPIPRSPLHEPSVPQGIMALVAPPPNSVLSSSLASSPFVSTSSAPSSPPPSLPRALSNGRGQTRPAYQRPAFSSRPSLPTLDTLARMNVVMTKKARKGRVGAGLPFEPWDELPSDEEVQTPVPRTPSSSSSSSVTSSSSNGAITPPMVDVPSSSSNSSSSSSTSSSNDNVLPPPVPEPPTSQPPQPQARQPQPLLPSQILALGSIAADVEMVLPVPTSRVMPHTTSPPPSFNTSTEILPSHSLDSNLSYSQDLTTLTSQTQNQNQPSSSRLGPSDAPVSNSSSLTASSHIRPVDPSGANFDDPATAIALRLSGLGEFADEMNAVLNGVDGEVISNEPDEVKVEDERDRDRDSLMEKPDSGALSLVEGSTEDGYLSDFLESYQRGTEDGMDDEDDGFDTRSYVDDSGTLTDGVEEVDEIQFAARSHLSYFYVSDEDDENNWDRQNSDGYYDNRDGEINTPELPAFPASESHLPSHPSSSIPLSRSLSSKSYFSHCSSNSSGGMEYPNTNAHPNHSLSSLELELDGPAKSESSSMLSRSLSERERIADSSTRRSSGSYHTHSHDGTPALSRTRSSSEDSDVPLHSPNEDDWTSFPYSYQPGGPAMFHPTSQSALFASSLGSRQAEQRAEHEHHASEIFHLEAESSFTHQTCHVGDSARSDEDDLEHAFEEYPYSQLLPGSVGSGAGFGFGFDKIMLTREVADVNGNEELLGNEKEKDGRLATSTSSSIDIEVHRTTITTPSESSSLNGTPPPDTNNSLVSHSRILSYVSSQITGAYTRTRTPPSTPCESAESLPLVDMDLLRASLATSQMSLDQPEDGGGGRYPSGNSGPWSAAANYSYQTNCSLASLGPRSVRGRGGRRNFGDEDDEDDERRPPRRATFERESGAEDAKQSSEEDEEDGYGSPSRSPNEVLRQPHQRPPTRPWVSTSTGASGSRSASPSASTFPRSRSNITPDSTATATSSMLQTRFPVSSHSHKHYNGSSTSSSRYVSEAESDSDDDVPLAQRIPGALTMQKTIRRQFKEEKEVRRRERAHRQQEGDSERRSRQMTLRPAGAGGGHDGSTGLGNSSSHDAAILAAASVSLSSQPKRQRTLTLPGNSAPPLPSPAAFNPQDLARKLAHVQLAEVASSTQHAQFLPQQQTLPSFQQQHLRSRSKSVSRTSGDAPRPYDPAFNYATPPTAPPLPIAPSSASTTRSRSIRDPSSASSAPCHGRSPISSTTPLQPPSHVPSLPSLRPKRSFRQRSPSRPSNDDPRSIPPFPNGAGSGQILRASTTSRPNRETSQIKRSASLSRVNAPVSRESPPPVPPVNLSRTSGDEQRKVSMKAESRMVSTRPSMDVERPQRNQALPAPITKSTVSQQRVFVGNLQQFNMIEIGPTTTAGDAVSMMEAGGALVGWAGSGGWMVFEIAQDFGMERPIRSYELLADVQAGWLKDKTVNFFILRLTPLAGPLDRNSIPSSSPTYSGYVEWEAKRGKWSKRWMQLREHSIWLSKRDNGRDETLLCSLSNFDAYQITRAHRAPKPFAFAIKSTDNLSFFENTADYLHTFACSEKDGKAWMEKILVARSYVLHQERNVLFNPKPDATAAIARSGTRKTSSAAAHRPAVAQPLVPLLPLFASSTQSLPQNDVFEPGSLLSKQP